MHRRNLIHRDIKGGNILIDSNGVLKLADFGLARDLKPEVVLLNSEKQPLRFMFTTKVVTRWYRAPEVALEDPFYTAKIDIWSIGCVFAELISRRPVFAAKSDLDLLPTILH